MLGRDVAVLGGEVRHPVEVGIQIDGESHRQVIDLNDLLQIPRYPDPPPAASDVLDRHPGRLGAWNHRHLERRERVVAFLDPVRGAIRHDDRLAVVGDVACRRRRRTATQHHHADESRKASD